MVGVEFAVSTALGLPGVIDVCVRLGDTLYSRLETYRTRDTKISDYCASFALHHDNLRDAFLVTQRIAPSLDLDIAARLIGVIERLRDILLHANGAIAKYTSPVGGSTDKIIHGLRWALDGERSLATLLSDLETWEKQFLTRQTLITLVRSSEEEGAYRTTRSPAYLQNVELQGLISQRIPLLLPHATASSSGEGLRELEDNIPIADQVPLVPGSTILRSRTKPDVLIEHYSLSRSRNAINEVPELASKLHVAEPDLMQILPCSSYFLRESAETYELRFAIPESYSGSSPRSLRSLLLDPITLNKRPQHALNDRLRLANSLAIAIWYIHSGNFVHKSVRPENIILLDPSPSSSGAASNRFPHIIPPAFLLGFDSFRKEETKSFGFTSVPPVELLYRHKSRWYANSNPTNFNMLHDIYSLGVCLLEVGLWESLVVAPDKLDRTRYAPGLRSRMKGGADDKEKVQEWLVETARTVLPREMGREFGQIVAACLTCLEGGLGEISADGERRNVMVQYMAAVIERLENIRI